MSLSVIPLAITMNAGPQIMSDIIFVTTPRALRLSASFLAGGLIAVTVGVTITYTIASVVGNSISLGDPSDSGSIGNIIQHRMPDTPAPLGLGSSIGPSFISLRGVPA